MLDFLAIPRACICLFDAFVIHKAKSAMECEGQFRGRPQNLIFPFVETAIVLCPNERLLILLFLGVFANWNSFGRRCESGHDQQILVVKLLRVLHILLQFCEIQVQRQLCVHCGHNVYRQIDKSFGEKQAHIFGAQYSFEIVVFS